MRKTSSEPHSELCLKLIGALIVMKRIGNYAFLLVTRAREFGIGIWRGHRPLFEHHAVMIIQHDAHSMVTEMLT